MGRGLTLRGMRELSGAVDMFYILIEVVVPQLYVFIKTHRSVPWKRVNVTIYKLHLSKAALKLCTINDVLSILVSATWNWQQ